MRRAASILILFLFCATVCVAAATQAKDKTEEALKKEQEKLNRISDPVGFTKASIKVSELLLTLAGQAAKAGDLQAMESRLNEYVGTIQKANETMARTGVDAHRKPKGFKELEIALRRQGNLLKDIGGMLSFDQREPVEKAREQASVIRESLIKALFGGVSANAG